NVASSSGSSGGVAGKMKYTDVLGVLVHNDSTKDDSALVISGAASSGGIVGTAENVSFDHSAASVYVSSTGNSGGLAGSVSASVVSLKNAGAPLNCAPDLLNELCSETDRLKVRTDALAEAVAEKPSGDLPEISAAYMRNTVLPAMSAVRESADHLERITDRKYWPFPTYDELLFSIQ
ncbi:MAG: hypothetical protein IJK14_04230, partial [Clostridia bacterium]|nr:hypothetical protein [Clostridia bacterium]